MSLHSFVKDTVTDTTETTPSATPEPSRRYVQWKEDDVGLLLTDLEQPGHYNKWKENKSGFSKRVAEGVFNNVMYHEAIKFKVRWLESRFKIWHQLLTSPEVANDEAAIANTREKMFKEFPYYDRCKPIFLNEISSTTIMTPAPAATIAEESFTPHVHPETRANATSGSRSGVPLKSTTTIMKPEPSPQLTNEPSSPTLETGIDSQTSHTNKRISSSPPFTTLKKKKVSSSNSMNRPTSTTTASASNNYYVNHNMNNSDCIYRNTENGITEDRRVQMMEFELELKKMDHQERMQEMKLEQLRLEIELQKLKRDTPRIHHLSSTD